MISRLCCNKTLSNKNIIRSELICSYYNLFIISQILPENFNMKSTFMLNYEVLVGMYRERKNHKLQEWHDLCSWIESLPYSELITGECDEEKIYSFDFCGHHGEVYVPANATETEINAAIFEEMSKMVEITKKYEWTVDKK